MLILCSSLILTSLCRNIKMMLAKTMYKVVSFMCLFETVLSLNIKRYVIEDTHDDAVDKLDFRKVLDMLSRSKENPQNYRRMEERAEKVKFLYELLTSKVGPAELQQWLRHQGEPESPSNIPRTDLEGLIENELKNALALKSSALLDRPVVEKRGKNDFLVIKPNFNDPFVTVIPNDIYYNIEKSCVNWLDDCNSKGIRSRLLQRVKYPFK